MQRKSGFQDAFSASPQLACTSPKVFSTISPKKNFDQPDYGFSIIGIPHKNFNYCPLGKSRPVNTSPIAKSTRKQTTFCISRGETFGGVAECRLFSQAKAI